MEANLTARKLASRDPPFWDHTRIGYRNVRTMHDIGRAAQVAREMVQNRISINKLAC